MRLRRLPIESAAPVVWFAELRVLVTVSALLSLPILSFPYGGELFAALAGLALPWAVAMLLLARRSALGALNPAVAVGDFAVLVAIEALVPETYGAVRFVALFMIAAHAHFQGAQIGLGIAGGGAGALILAGVATDAPLGSDLTELYEVLFAVSALATAAVVGGLRTAESTGRLRARLVTRRTFEAEDELRRRLAESIHDGPVQELVSLDLMLGAAQQAAQHGDAARAAELIGEAQGLAARNVRALRDEIVALGPQAVEELSFEAAVEQAVPIWERRYGFDVEVDCEPLPLDSEIDGALFRIAQEAVANARHADASSVTVRLRGSPEGIELSIADNGRGFGGIDPLGPNEPGHLGLASMRERAEAAGGRLGIASGSDGTVVLVTVPGVRRTG